MQRETIIAEFQHLQDDLNSVGYLKKDMILSSSRTMIVGTLYALPLVIIFGFVYRFLLLDHARLLEMNGLSFYIMFLAIIIVSVIIHECLHGLGWALFSGKSWSSIRFNFHAMMPSCACRIPLSREKYLIGVLLPVIVLGGSSVVFMFVHPGTVSVLTMIVNIILSGADIMIATSVIKEKGALIVDHPIEAGYVAFIKR